MSPTQRTITRAHLDVLFKFKAVNPLSSMTYALTPQAEVGDLIVRCSLEVVLNLYGHWRPGELRTIARVHGINVPARRSRLQIMQILQQHVSPTLHFECVFAQLAAPRSVSHAPSVVQAQPSETPAAADPCATTTTVPQQPIVDEHRAHAAAPRAAPWATPTAASHPQVRRRLVRQRQCVRVRVRRNFDRHGCRRYGDWNWEMRCREGYACWVERVWCARWGVD